MTKRPLGVFDSGVGGLSAVRVLRDILPDEDIIYFADTANVPYGTREVPELLELSRSAALRLAALGVKAILVACGTVSASCLEAMRESSGLPVYGVIAPAAAEAASHSSGRIGVLSTMATARSGAFERELRALLPDAELLTRGNTGLVPLAEAGRVRLDDAEVRAELEGALRPFSDWGADTLILGCTHFPLFSAAVSEMLPGTALIDSAGAGAREFKRRLAGAGLLSAGGAAGALRCLVSGDTAAFGKAARIFLPSAAKLCVEKA